MLKTIILGILFGVILQRSRVNTFDKIGGFAMLRDFTVPKILFSAIGVGSILFFIQTKMGLASLSLKPFLVTGVVLGGIIFGMGMAILGYCPGTAVVAVGEGALDALVGIAGGLLGGWVFILLYPALKPSLGPDLGKVSLYAPGPFSPWLLVFTYGFLMVALALYLSKREKARKSSSWQRY